MIGSLLQYLIMDIKYVHTYDTGRNALADDGHRDLQPESFDLYAAPPYQKGGRALTAVAHVTGI